MKKTKLTIEQHREMGAELKAFRNERLVKYLASIHKATRANSPQLKAVRNALDAIDRLRGALDDLACKHYGDELGAAVTRIYYGKEDELVADEPDKAVKSKKGTR